MFRCESSLSFLDADGMRFHIPAFMIAELNGELNTGPLFCLTHLSEHSEYQFSSLSKSQRNAVRQFLLWCLSQDDYEFDWPIIEPTLKDYWNET